MIRALIALLACLSVLSACAMPSGLRNESTGGGLEDGESEESFFDLFRNQGDPDRGVVVNRYLWQASLDALAFLPLEAADPFSGIISTGWGSVNGSAFRATVLISQPALDARSLKVAAFRRSGGRAVPVGDAENRAIENAILTRAREMRIARGAR